MSCLKAFAALLGIYILWVTVSWLLYEIPRLWPIVGDLQTILFPLLVVLFVLLGCFVNAFYLIYVESRLAHKPKVRFICLLVVLFIAVLMYMAARQGAIRSPVFYMIYTVNLLVFANFLGVWIAAPLKREAELVLVCLAMALADLFSIIRGPTRIFIKSIQTYYESGLAGPPPVSDFLLVKISVPGLAHLQPVFGISDWIIVVFLSAAAVKFRIPDNLLGKGLAAMQDQTCPSPYFPVAAAGLIAAIFTAVLLNRFIPVLPVIAVLFVFFVLVRRPAARALTRSDWYLMGIFSIVMLGLLGLGWLMTT